MRMYTTNELLLDVTAHPPVLLRVHDIHEQAIGLSACLIGHSLRACLIVHRLQGAVQKCLFPI